jgi:hypothetical protein
MQEQQVLRMEDAVHRFVLVLVFLPLLQQALDEFSNGWDNHPVPKLQGRTPLQAHELDLTVSPKPPPLVALTDLQELPDHNDEEADNQVRGCRRKGGLMVMVVVT